ncbi:ornithine cyclodeaminase family protein [Pseudomonas yamanorum]|nr:ornithine cyclodeaminase family protein [Pseudomonas yamanorum]
MGSEATLKLLDKGHVDALLDHEQALQAVREAFTLHSLGDGQVFSVVRESLSTGGIFGIKSGGVSNQNLLGFKAAGFWPNNRKLGSEPHQATIMLIDPLTGRPQCLIDGNTITTLRTGAAGALGLQLLARPESTNVCVFGSGVQARVQIDYALQVIPGITYVLYLTATGKPDIEFERRFASRVEVTHCTDADKSVCESDVVITATPGSGPLFDSESVQAGTHITCVGADTKGKRELPEGLLARARVVVDDRIQAQSIGECQWDTKIDSTELGDLITGTARLDRGPYDITIFDMTGLALQDLAVARRLYNQACEKQVGHDIAWPW